jgi:hypothetical protein
MRTRVVSDLVLLAVVVLAACAGGDGDVVAGAPTRTAPPPVDVAAPFSLWLSADRVPPGPAEVVAVLVDHGGGDATFGVGATVDRWEDGAWVAHGQLVMCMDHWHCTARMQDAGGELATPAIGVSATVGQPGPVERFTTDGLDVGWYRISQEANEGVVASGILEVAEGAPAPAPLVALDEPAISVQPPLLAPDGGPVTLHPLIPPVAGSQSIEDVEAGVEGLSESAAVERWEAGTWVPVVEIGFEPAPAPPLHTRTVAMPALPVGDYRLVRTGPDGDHAGRFWVTDPEADEGAETAAHAGECDDEALAVPTPEVASQQSRAPMDLLFIEHRCGSADGGANLGLEPAVMSTAGSVEVDVPSGFDVRSSLAPAEVEGAPLAGAAALMIDGALVVDVPEAGCHRLVVELARDGVTARFAILLQSSHGSCPQPGDGAP